MIRSRASLAMIDAAAIDSDLASPLTTASQGRTSPFGDQIAVDQQVIRRRVQRRHRALHRQMGGAQNIQGINLFDRCVGNGRLRAGQDPAFQCLTLFQAQFLGVVQTVRDRGGIQNHRRRRHRPGQRAAAHLIHSGNSQMPLGKGGGF